MPVPIFNADASIYLCALFQDSLREKYNVGKILHLHYLICMLLPVLKQINLDQSDELETEATTKGNGHYSSLISGFFQ